MSKLKLIAIAPVVATCGLIVFSNGGVNAQTTNLEACNERLAAFQNGSGGAAAKRRARKHGEAAKQYDWQAEKWEELAEKAHTDHLRHAYLNEARGLRMLADAEREKSMGPAVAEEALNTECGQQLAALSKVDEVGPKDAAPVKAVETNTPAKAKARAKPKPSLKKKAITKTKAKKKASTRKRATSAKKRVKWVKKRVVVRKRVKRKRTRTVRRARPRVVIGIGIGIAGIGIGF